MRRITTVCFFLMISLSVADAGVGRSSSWHPTRVLGSEQLRLSELESIVVLAESTSELDAAVEDFRSVYLDRVGVGLAQVADPSEQLKHAVQLCLTEPYDSTGAFFIKRAQSNIVISAASSEGLINGLYAFCGEILGARWYWASELGLEYVGIVPERFLKERWSEEPAFIQRALYPQDTEFGRRNRLNRPFQFNHALGNVFSPELYDREPEVFSVVNGRKRKPKGSAGTDPQPHLAHPRAVEIAAEEALKFFADQPESLSFSLSINDNVLFDETELTQAQVSPLRYFRTRPDYTNYVFNFMNAVAEKVFDEAGEWQNMHGEDRYLTALAYYWTEPSPTIQIHPRVMPVLTSDRAQWHDPQYRVEDKALIDRWADSGAERIATWDYYFGAPYPYPRQFNQWAIESIQYLDKAGVDVFFSQLPSAWGLDGPKAWLTAELLWNPQQDAEALLDEYYIHFFGAAAQPMRDFYETAEEWRDQHEGKADWIKFYKDESGVGLFSLSVLSKMRALIKLAENAVLDDPRRLKRIEVVSEAFTFTETYAQLHQAKQRLIEGVLIKSADLEDRLNDYRSARRVYQERADQLVAMPMHQRLNTFSRILQSDPELMALLVLAEMDQSEDFAAPHELGAWVKDQSIFRSSIQNVELAHDGTSRRNFLGPDMPIVAGWHFDFRPSEKLKVGGVEGASVGIRSEGADVVSVFRDIPAMPERVYLLDVSARWQVSPDNRTQIKLIWTDSNGSHLRTDIPLQLPWGASADVQRILIPFESPKNAYDVRVHFVSSRQYEGDFLELHRVDFGALYSK